MCILKSNHTTMDGLIRHGKVLTIDKLNEGEEVSLK